MDYETIDKIFLCALALTSCSAMIDSAYETNLTDRPYLTVEIVQTLSETSGIALTKDNKAVKIVSPRGMMYGGKTFSGSFVLVGTYSYEANSGMVKTIPTYVSINEYKRYKQEQGID